MPCASATCVTRIPSLEALLVTVSRTTAFRSSYPYLERRRSHHQEGALRSPPREQGNWDRDAFTAPEIPGRKPACSQGAAAGRTRARAVPGCVNGYGTGVCRRSWQPDPALACALDEIRSRSLKSLAAELVEELRCV